MQRKSKAAKHHNREVEGREHPRVSVGVQRGVALLPRRRVTRPTDVAHPDPEPHAVGHSQAQGQRRDGLRHPCPSFPLALRFSSGKIKQEANGRTFYIFSPRLAHQVAHDDSCLG